MAKMEEVFFNADILKKKFIGSQDTQNTDQEYIKNKNKNNKVNPRHTTDSYNCFR